MTLDLVTWLRACLDEDAEQLEEARWDVLDHWWLPSYVTPDGLRAEIAAKRAILDNTEWSVSGHKEYEGCPDCGDHMATAAYEAVIRLLAQPYAGRAGWLEEWAVKG